ncbi:heterokaryon incompatibility, partial [Setomelanomma holmii]
IVTVTPNVHDVLVTLRLRTDARVVWIDALCICQADAREKSDQVPLMSRIYSAAERVIVWLG